MVTRGILVVEGDRYRVRERGVLRYYARTIEHLLKDESLGNVVTTSVTL